MIRFKDRAHWLYLAVIAAVLLGTAAGFLAPGVGTELKPLGEGFVAPTKMIISPASSSSSGSWGHCSRRRGASACSGCCATSPGSSCSSSRRRRPRPRCCSPTGPSWSTASGSSSGSTASCPGRAAERPGRRPGPGTRPARHRSADEADRLRLQPPQPPERTGCRPTHWAPSRSAPRRQDGALEVGGRGWSERDAGLGAPHGAGPLEAASLGTRGYRSPAPSPAPGGAALSVTTSAALCHAQRGSPRAIRPHTVGCPRTSDGWNT